MELLEAPRRKARWVPKVWELQYTQMVLLSTSGHSNEDIAKHFNVSKQHVSNITNTPQAAIIRRKVLDALQERVAQSIPERLEAIADKAIQRAHALVHDDELYARSPFAVVDRGIRFLEGVGKLKKEPGSLNVEKAVILTAEHSKDLLDGLRKADRARELHKDTFMSTAEVINEKT